MQINYIRNIMGQDYRIFGTLLINTQEGIATNAMMVLSQNRGSSLSVAKTAICTNK